MADVYGTDISNDWTFTNGDIDLVSGKSNLEQAIYNRLKTDWDTYQEFYRNYGGHLSDHYGDINLPNIQEYIRIEIEDILQQEPRIRNVECTVNKTDTDGVEVTLKYSLIGEDDTQTLNLVLSDDLPIFISENSSELKIRS